MPSGTSLLVSGIIDERALARFDEAIENSPDATTLVFQYVPGSLDDHSNLILARRVRAMGLQTEIPASGLVASGGTDLFLAGEKRSISGGACVGVHTWGDETVGIGSQVPRSDPIHALYLEYYKEMGIDEAFYWFTLDAAGPEDTHWMTLDEITEYSMTTTEQETSSSQSILLLECEERLVDGFERLLSK